MITSSQFTKKLIIISFKLKIFWLYIWSLHSSTIKSVLKKKKKKSTHPSDQKKVNCWDRLMIRTNTVSTLKARLRRTGTNREGFYSALIFTLGDVCAEPSRFSEWRQPAWCRGWVRKEGRTGGRGQWEFLSPQLQVQEEQCWERWSATPRSAETDSPPPVLSPTTSWLFNNIYTFPVVNCGALFSCPTWWLQGETH